MLLNNEKTLEEKFAEQSIDFREFVSNHAYRSFKVNIPPEKIKYTVERLEKGTGLYTNVYVLTVHDDKTEIGQSVFKERIKQDELDFYGGRIDHRKDTASYVLKFLKFFDLSQGFISSLNMTIEPFFDGSFDERIFEIYNNYCKDGNEALKRIIGRNVEDDLRKIIGLIVEKHSKLTRDFKVYDRIDRILVEKLTKGNYDTRARLYLGFIYAVIHPEEDIKDLLGDFSLWGFDPNQRKAIQELEAITEYLADEKNSVILFDTRPDNILFRSEKSGKLLEEITKYEITDYCSVGIGRPALDFSILLTDFELNLLLQSINSVGSRLPQKLFNYGMKLQEEVMGGKIPVKDIRNLTESDYKNLLGSISNTEDEQFKEEFLMSGIWAVLKSAGISASFQFNHPDKYLKFIEQCKRNPLKNADLYENREYIADRLSFLVQLVEKHDKSRKFENLRWLAKGLNTNNQEKPKTICK